MKKAVMIGAVILLIGAVTAFVGIKMVDYDFGKITNMPEYTEKELTLDGITKIEITEDTCDIKAIPSADGKMRVRYFENENETYEITYAEGGTKLVMKKKSKSPAQWFTLSLKQVNLIIELPSDYNGELKTETDTGDITVKDLDFSAAEFETETGDVSLTKVTANRLAAETETGDITIGDTAADIIMTETETGDISLTKITANKVSAETETGELTLKDTDVKEIGLETETGDIKGVLCGRKDEYTVTAKTETGRNNLQNTAGGTRKLTVKTETGDIKIQFAE